MHQTAEPSFQPGQSIKHAALELGFSPSVVGSISQSYFSGIYTKSRTVRDQVIVRLKSGERIGNIASDLNLTYGTVHEIAGDSGVIYVGKHLCENQRREITHRRMIRGESIRQIAAGMNLPKSKIGRFTRSQYHAEVNAGGTVVAPTELVKPRRCPTHGLMRLWPCVACAAVKRKNDSGPK